MKRKIIWGLIIGIGLVSVLLWSYTKQGTPWNVSIVKKGDIKKYVEDVGTIKSKNLKNVSIEGSGLIRNIAADTGQRVKTGDLLLSMDKEQLEIALKNADEKIKEIEATFRGSDVKNYADRLEKARIGVKQANDTYLSTLNNYNNSQALYETGAVSRDELNQRNDALKNAQALLNSAKVDLQLIEKNTPDDISNAFNAQLEQAVLNRESLLISLGKQDVVSPMDGVILEKKVEVNTVGVPGSVAFVIGDVENIEIEAYILADDASDINLGDAVEMVERSEKKQVFEGKVAKIAPSAITVTSSLGVNQKKVLITIEPSDKTVRLKPGYEVDVKVITQNKSNALIVPVSSVFDYKGKPSVFVVEAEKAVLREVQKGIQDEMSVEITAGLKEGEIILTQPDTSIKEGMRIKPLEAE